MNIAKIMHDMQATLSRDNERYEVVDSEHVKDLLTGYEWHFYPNGSMKVTRNEKVIFTGESLDAESQAAAQYIGKMLRNHYMTEFITEHSKLYKPPAATQNGAQPPQPTA